MAMKQRCLWLVLALAAQATSVPAADLHLEFVEGLRSRRYFDTAVLYLDQIESDPTLPADVRQVIPFERGVTLLKSARSLGPEARREPLDRALAQFEAFTAANPDHPLAAQANTEQANILLENARLAIWQARSPNNQGNAQTLRDEARQLINQARVVFQKAHDQHKAAWEAFPVFIDESDRQQRQAREQALTAYMQSQLDLAMCAYEEAQTQSPDSAEFKQQLTVAAEAFEAIHTQYRTVVVGLYARMWQAKCFEEQGDLRKALGIYDELLRHTSDSRSYQVLKGNVRHFWCICQNQRDEHQLVIQAAEEWIAAQRNQSAMLRSSFGIGIRWEYVQALEARAEDRTLAPRDKEQLLRKALNEAEDISRIAGQYRDVASFAVPRIKVALNIDPGDPRDFDTALGTARTMIKPGIFERQQAIEAEKTGQNRREELALLEQDLADHLRETARMLKLAVELSEAQTPSEQMLEANYLLAYVYYLQDRAFDAAVLAEFVGRKYREADPEFALKAAYLSMAAWTKAYNASSRPEDERTFEVDRIVRACQLVTEHWPQSEEAQGARIQLGRIFSRRDQPAEAAKWYSQVPESAEDYSEAQLAAGQAYWNAWLDVSRRTSDEDAAAEQPSAETLNQWQQAAEQHLQIGIERESAATPKDQPAPSDLIAAKVTMAQILVNRGEYEAAVNRLQAEPHAPVQAIQVPEGQARPKTGVTSAAFASLVYQLFLRAYVGTKNIDEALRVMEQLEQTVPEGDDGTALTAIYINLGRELQNEIERLRANPSGNRLTDVLASFEEFLNALSAQRERMNYSALIWIAETYYYLAEGMGSGNAQAQAYYARAAETYQDILNRPTGFIPGGKDLGVKLRLVNCLRSQGDFEPALELVSEVLSAEPMALQAQIEAARLLQSWGDSGQPDSHKYYLQAIQGRDIQKQDKAIWGWGGIVRMLADRPDYQDQALDARYNSAVCRREYGLAHSSGAKGKQAIEQAKTELEMFARVSGPERVGDEWWQKFEGIYRTLQNDLNQIPMPLPRPETYQPRPTTSIARGNGRGSASPETRSSRGGRQQVSNEAQSSGSSLPTILGALVAIGGAAGLMYWYVKSQQGSRRRSVYATSAATPLLAPAPAAAPAAGARKTKSSRPAGTAARRSRSAGGEAAQKAGGTEPPVSTGPAARPPGTRPRTGRTGQPPASS